jgi:short-subunit dehydrogenase
VEGEFIMGERYREQVVVVTGGGRGIGRAIALEFACEGATVIVAGRRMDALATSAQECRESGGRAETAHCDVAKDADLQSLVEKAIETHGRIDVLVNNAGVATSGRLDEMSEADIGRMARVNVWAPMRLTQLVVPHMRARKQGAIINISSVAGWMALPYMAPYCATKFALRGFTEAMRRELAPDGIHVMAVFPGPTATDMIESVDFGGFPMSIATADSVAKATLRALRYRQPEVFVGLGDAMLRWNEVAPWMVDVGVDLMRGRIKAAAEGQRTV